MHERFKENKSGKLVTVYDQGRTLSDMEISDLEEQVKATPNCLETRAKLLGAYLLPSELRRRPDPGRRYRAHLLWIVEHDPRTDLGPVSTQSLLPEEDPELFKELGLLWARKMAECPNDFDIAFNASIFFESAGALKVALEVAQKAKSLIGKDHITDKRIRFLKRLIREHPREGTWKQLVENSEDLGKRDD